MESDEPTTVCTRVVSVVRRESTSPVCVVSKNCGLWRSTWSYTALRRSAVTRSPSQLTRKKRAALNTPSATATPNSSPKLPRSARARAPRSLAPRLVSIRVRSASGKASVAPAASTRNSSASAMRQR